MNRGIGGLWDQTKDGECFREEQNWEVVSTSKPDGSRWGNNVVGIILSSWKEKVRE